MKKNQKGFTLIELMIVVAIIGILAAIALPKFADMLEKSREGATRGNLDSIKSAINIYNADQAGAYPVILTDTHAASSTDVNFVKKYMDSLPSVKVTAKSDLNANALQGSGPGVGNSIVTSAIIQTNYNGAGNGVATTALNANTAGKGWRYDSIEGRMWVNSNLIDMSANTYTTYGY
jgi:type IV pilus assembly protein PilA